MLPYRDIQMPVMSGRFAGERKMAVVRLP